MQIGESTRSRILYLAAVVCAATLSHGAFSQTFDLDAGRVGITQVDSSWRFQLGDDPRWAQPGFDDSRWPVLRPAEDWTTQGYPAKTELAWFRFHLVAPAHTSSLVLELPAIEKSYQLFSDGQLIAQIGVLPPERPHLVIGAARVFTLPVNSGSAAKDIVVALRLWQDPATAGARPSVLDGDAFAGDPAAVLRHFDDAKTVDLMSTGAEYTSDIVILIVGAAAALLFWFTREYFYLWFACNLVLESSFLAVDFVAQHQAWGLYSYTYIEILIDLLSRFAYILFIVSAVYPGNWKRGILPAFAAIVAEVSIVLALTHSTPILWSDIGYCVAMSSVTVVLGWYLIRGWRAGNLYAKLLFIPFAISGLLLISNNLGAVIDDMNAEIGGKLTPGHYHLLRQPFDVTLSDVGGLISLLGVLAVLVYRFARTSRDQQRLSAALKAAHDIQNRLVPVEIPTMGGLNTEIAYHAAEEVGGDFCQILPRPDGSIFVAIGDVSGKGLQAALLGAVAVGALRSMAGEEISPSLVLERLNGVLLRTANAGFTTCLCLIISPEGAVAIANAGHLPPYLNGVEVKVLGGLPLGVVAGTEYEQQFFSLPDSARLTLLSDGVVEARSTTGELFGFERTTRVSSAPASQIAATAREFGQEDDITVITLDWQPLHVAAQTA